MSVHRLLLFRLTHFCLLSYCLYHHHHQVLRLFFDKLTCDMISFIFILIRKIDEVIESLFPTIFRGYKFQIYKSGPFMLTMTEPMDAQTTTTTTNNNQNTNDNSNNSVKRFSFLRKTTASKPREITKNIKYGRLYCLTSASQKEVVIMFVYTLDKIVVAQPGQGDDEVQVLSIRCKWFSVSLKFVAAVYIYIYICILANLVHSCCCFT